MHVAVAGGPIPIWGSQTGTRVSFARAPADGHKSEARRRHETLLRSRDCDVDAPFIHFERHAAKRGNHIHHEQSAVPRSFDRPADCINIVGDTRGGIDLDGQYCLDLARLVLS